MAVSNFVPGAWDAPLMAMLKRDQPIIDLWVREQRERMIADGFEEVAVTPEWIAERDAFWEKFEALVAFGEMNDFIRYQPDEGFEKTTHTSEWVKKGSK
jgi:hypothetical protein